MGATVALVAPSGPSPAERLTGAVTLLQRWGYSPVCLPSAIARHPRAGYLSGEDAVRARDVQDAWCDPDVAAIVCLRGGYGAVRVLDLLDVELMAAVAPTPLFGSSDITALHEWLRERLGAAGWFTPMPSTLSVLEDEAAATGLRAALAGAPGGWRVGSDAAVPLVPGTASGVTIGGNLSLLAMTLGARHRPPVDNTGAIVLLEDVTEDTYRLDGYLQSLLRAGWFDGVAGIALGSWLDCGPVPEIHDLVLEALGPLGVPIAGELGFGHGLAAQSVPLGVAATLQVDPGGRVELRGA